VTEPLGRNDAVAQIVALGKAPQAWIWSAMILRRSAEVLSSLSADGESRHLELAFQDPDPLPGEIRERPQTPEETAALVDLNAAGVSAMLLASSVECLLKARLASAGIQLISVDGVLQKRFKTHDLRRLATQAGLELPEPSLRLLDGLSAFLEWRGRYPIPTKWERLRELEALELGTIRDFQGKAFALADEILESLK
jgi:hypothetical protein